MLATLLSRFIRVVSITQSAFRYEVIQHKLPSALDPRIDNGKLKVGNDLEMLQSERNPHSKKNDVEKKTKSTMKHSN